MTPAFDATNCRSGGMSTDDRRRVGVHVRSTGHAGAGAVLTNAWRASGGADRRRGTQDQADEIRLRRGFRLAEDMLQMRTHRMDADTQQAGCALDMLAAREQRGKAALRGGQAVETAECRMIQFDRAVGVADDEGKCRPFVVGVWACCAQLLYDDRER